MVARATAFRQRRTAWSSSRTLAYNVSYSVRIGLLPVDSAISLTKRSNASSDASSPSSQNDVTITSDRSPTARFTTVIPKKWGRSPYRGMTVPDRLHHHCKFRRFDVERHFPTLSGPPLIYLLDRGYLY